MPTLTYTRPWLYPKQEHAIFNDARIAVIEASTKAGKTVGCMVWLAEQAMAGKPAANFWWIAPVYQQAEIVYRRLKRALPAAIYRPNDSRLTITLGNGAVLWFKSAEKPDNLYGEDVFAAVMDEATRTRPEAFYAIRSTLTATNGRLRIIGNVKGRKNWAYQLARRAESHEDGMAYARITAHDAVDAGVLDADEIASAKRLLPPHVFAELYLAEPSDDGGNPFGLDAIRACLVPALSPLRPVAWGWDLARWQDYTVGIGLDRTGTAARLDYWQGLSWHDTTQRILIATGKTPAWVDATHGSVGDPLVETLQRGRDNYHAFTFTAPSKQALIEALVLAIHRQAVHFPDGLIRAQLDSFEYEVTRTGVRYTAPEGMHDDAVIALALAVHGRANLPLPGVFATRAVRGWQPPGVR